MSEECVTELQKTMSVHTSSSSHITTLPAAILGYAVYSGCHRNAGEVASILVTAEEDAWLSGPDTGVCFEKLLVQILSRPVTFPLFG